LAYLSKESEMQQEIADAIARIILFLVVILLIEVIAAGFTIAIFFNAF